MRHVKQARAGDVDAARVWLRDAQRREDLDACYEASRVLVQGGCFDEARAWCEQQLMTYACGVCQGYGKRVVRTREMTLHPPQRIHTERDIKLGYCDPRMTMVAVDGELVEVNPSDVESISDLGEHGYAVMITCRACPTHRQETARLCRAIAPLAHAMLEAGEPWRRIETLALSLWFRAGRTWWPDGWWEWLSRALGVSITRPSSPGSEYLWHMGHRLKITEGGWFQMQDRSLPRLPQVPDCVCVESVDGVRGLCPGINGEECVSGSVWGLHGPVWSACPMCHVKGRCPRCGPPREGIRGHQVSMVIVNDPMVTDSGGEG